jgi:hypothetical protein
MKTSMTCLPVLIVPNWNVEFHVHTNASNFALVVMLGKNPNNTIDKPIYYVDKLMNSVERNCSTIEKEALAMIYAIRRFQHYLLGNSFTFFIDHQALLHLVNKPMVRSHIARWLLLLQEFNLKIVYKLGQVHFVPDQLFQISHGEPTIRVEDQLLDAMLFTTGINWYGPIL